jgi:hypothetical protein
MPKIYDLLKEEDGRGLYLGTYGYSQVPETALLTFDMYELNKENLDFRSMALKQVGKKSSPSEDGEQIKWYDQDLKKATVSIVTTVDAVTLTVSSTGLVPGEALYNQDTNETAFVATVAGANITLHGAGFVGAQYGAGNKLVRTSFAKLYGSDNGITAIRQDLIAFDNYLQIGERQIPSDLIDNNKNYLFIKNANERAAMIFGDQSRDIMMEVAQNFYVGKKAKQADSGTFRYYTGGLQEFIPVGAKTNIKGATDDVTKTKLRNELTKAYQSGVEGIWGNNKLLAFCTTKWADMIDSLYEDKLLYNDTLSSINVEIKTYNVGGKKLNMVVSNTLDYMMGDVAKCFLVPIDYAFLHIFPYGATDDSGKKAELYGNGIVYAKPRSTWEKNTIGLRTMYSFLFQQISSGAYREMTYA